MRDPVRFANCLTLQRFCEGCAHDVPGSSPGSLPVHAPPGAALLGSGRFRCPRERDTDGAPLFDGPADAALEHRLLRPVLGQILQHRQHTARA